MKTNLLSAARSLALEGKNAFQIFTALNGELEFIQVRKISEEFKIFSKVLV